MWRTSRVLKPIALDAAQRRLLDAQLRAVGGHEEAAEALARPVDVPSPKPVSTRTYPALAISISRQ